MYKKQNCFILFNLLSESLFVIIETVPDVNNIVNPAANPTS